MALLPRGGPSSVSYRVRVPGSGWLHGNVVGGGGGAIGRELLTSFRALEFRPVKSSGIVPNMLLSSDHISVGAEPCFLSFASTNALPYICF